MRRMSAAAAIALNRFGLGARPDDAPPGQPARWVLDQFERYQPLPPAWAGVPRTPDRMASYAALVRTVRTTSDPAAARQMFRREGRDDYLQAVGARASSALDTPAPFVERLVHFWSNHFAVSVEKFAIANLAGAFEADAIRPHVLGRFHDMVLAVARHPAMLLFLDQAQSIGPNSRAGRARAQANPEAQRGLNENLAREILELHTLGVRSGYSQADVTEFARALTGWSIDATGYQFRPALHEPGSRSVLGRSYPQGGEAQALAILHDLVRSPATATHVATKLARHFVADEPSPTLVHRLADAFVRSDGDLPAVYRALVESSEAWQPAAAKFKSPWEWAVSALRGLGRRDVPGMQAAALMAQLGQPVWQPGSPAGFDDVAAKWAAPDGLIRRVEAAQRLAAQTGPAVDARDLAPRLLPGVLSDATSGAIARAESPATGLALLLVSPEFLRR
jgi:uncharacterized protein (DUF1800 family)